MNVIDALQRGGGFTDTEVQMATHILSHPDSVAEMYIADLAEELHCSKASIVRLCKKMGLSGYRDFKIQLTRDLEHMRTSISSVDPDRPFREDSNIADVVNSVAVLSKQAIDACRSNIPNASILKAAQLICEARHLVYYGFGDTGVSLEMFSLLLSKVGITCTSGAPYGMTGVIAQHLDKRDLAIIASYSGLGVKRYTKPIDLLRAQGCKTIVITANEGVRDRLTGADCLIMLPRGEHLEERLASYYSQECTRYALNCIYAVIFAKDYDQHLAKWTRVWEEA